MAQVTKGYTFTSTEQVTNTKLHSLVDSATIGNITNSDVDTNAAIVDTKLAQLTTANKVSGSALCYLASVPAGGGVLQYANGGTGVSSLTGSGGAFLAVKSDESGFELATSTWVTGMICNWYGAIANIPSGFVLCDGTNSTPDMRDKMVVGAKQDDGGVPKTNVTGVLTSTGGSYNVTLLEANLPSHSHSMNHTHNIYLQDGSNPGTASPQGSTGTSTSHPDATGSSSAANTGNTGSGTAFSVMNPYIALAYIMKT